MAKNEEIIPEQPIVERVKGLAIEDEMQTSYINYAMSVIIGRALPDVRDGMKPVHRRVLFSMADQGITYDKPHKKCARVVGDVLGKYHPHGDSSIYGTLVRMAQEFSLRYPLVDGQGNYGSIDGDSAAAMRYTEARLSKIANELMADLECNTVDFAPNFDESLQEPMVLPTRLPNLLLNGSFGIAVGMATNIPPHNLSELCDGVMALVANPDLPDEALLQYVKGPDFPTGANICGTEGIRNMYLTGKGSIPLRAQISVEPATHKKDRECIIVSELPYQVNKAELIIRIADLVRDKKIQNISDLRDESGQQGMRIYIELKKDANPEVVLNQLYKHTPLQMNFNTNMLAIVDGAPRILTLKKVLMHFIDHRVVVITRRTQFLLDKALDKLHILEGLVIALNNIDEVIALIKQSKTTLEAKVSLMSRFGFSDKQATAILEMRLQRLTALETQKIESELAEIKTTVADYRDILANKSRVMGIIDIETKEIKDKYGDERRTRILGAFEELNIEDLIPKEDVAVFLTRNGFIKRMAINLFRTQQRGGKGSSGMETRDEDEIDSIFITNTHSYMVVFTDNGKVYRVKVHELPDASKNSKGQSISNFFQLEEGEKITTTVEVSDFTAQGQYILMCTKKGTVKKTEVPEFENIRRTGVIAITLDEAGDTLEWARRTDGNKDVLITTANGVLIRFSEADVRSMGRNAAGVRGITLDEGDKVVSMDVLSKEDDKKHALIISEGGYGKRTEVGEYRTQGRAGRGVRCLGLRDNDHAVKMSIVSENDGIILVTSAGTVIRQEVKAIADQGRAAMGVRIIRLTAPDKVVDVAVIRDTVVELTDEK